MLTSDQISQSQSTLQSMKEDLEHLLKHGDHFDIEKAFIQETVGELSNYDNHPADSGTELYEREKDVALLQHAEKALNDVNHALDRIKNGTFGTCEICQEKIPFERLEAMPTTAYCIKHTPDEGIHHERPVEEDVLRPPYGEFENDEKDATFFDSEDSWQDVAAYGTSETPSDFYEQGKMTYEQMFVEAEEPVGYVEDIEMFLTADLDGSFSGVAPNIIHEEYEEMLDEAENDTMYSQDTLDGLNSNEWKRYGE